ncbi:MAG: pitrilysin family protein [Elusimicrobiota bacterium]
MKEFFKNISVLLGGFIVFLLSATFLCSDYYFDSNTSTDLTAIYIWVKVGSFDEDKDNSGISHFIEHLIFKGTPTKTQKDIAPEIEKLGGIINAATSKDFTCFYTIVPSSYTLKATEILTDAVLNPVFPEDEIEKERKVILEEIKRKDDNPQSQLFDEFYKLVYEPTSYGKPVIGTAEIVTKLNRTDFLSFHKKFYTPQNIIVVVSGNFDRKSIFYVLKNGFSKLPKSKYTKKTNMKEFSNPEVQKSDSKIIIKKDVAHPYILMGFTGASVENTDQYALDLVSYVLGSGRASRLYKKLVEDTKLAYTIGCSFSTHRGPGLFYVYAECPSENTNSLINRVSLELLDITVNSVTNDELNRAKTLLIRDKLLQEQTPDGKAETIGFYATLGNPEIVKNYIKNIKKLKPQNIKKVMSKYLIFSNIPTVIITPLEN